MGLIVPDVSQNGSLSATVNGFRVTYADGEWGGDLDLRPMLEARTADLNGPSVPFPALAAVEALRDVADVEIEAVELPEFDPDVVY